MTQPTADAPGLHGAQTWDRADHNSKMGLGPQHRPCPSCVWAGLGWRELPIPRQLCPQPGELSLLSIPGGVLQDPHCQPRKRAERPRALVGGRTEAPSSRCARGAKHWVGEGGLRVSQKESRLLLQCPPPGPRLSLCPTDGRSLPAPQGPVAPSPTRSRRLCVRSGLAYFPLRMAPGLCPRTGAQPTARKGPVAWRRIL